MIRNLSTATGLLLASALCQAEPFSVFEPIVEINATDGDVGFHLLLDGDPWKVARVYDPDGDRMLKARATDDLLEQGITEFFIESAEPPCWDDGETDPGEIFTVDDFVERFEAGTYRARGRSIENVPLRARGELTHNLPAAPDMEVEVEIDDGEVEVEISWEPGTDLGQCEYSEGLIPDPATVPVVRWEVVVEPDVDEFPDGLVFAKFTMQVDGSIREVEIPTEFFAPYFAAGVVEFKGEVGAREASGNQTFTEFEFELGDEDEDD